MGSNAHIIGQKFNRLTVIERFGSTKQHKALWKCICDCGKFTIATTGSLKSSGTKSCGCLRQISPRICGKLHRKINYEKLKCFMCGKDIHNRFINDDGSIKEHLTFNRIKHLTCDSCLTQIEQSNGRKMLEINSHIEISKIQKDVIIGSILGDGSLASSPVENGNYGLDVKHGLKQERYCLWKASLLGKLITKIDYPQDRIRFRTKKHKIITEIANRFIINGRKSIDYESISGCGPMCFVIWYMDDGSLLPYRTSKKGTIRKPEIRFSTNCFTENENLVLREILEKKLNIKTTRCSWISKICFNKRLLIPKRAYGIRLYGDNAIKFLNYIKPYVDLEKSGMGYKFNTSLRGPLNNKHTRKRVMIPSLL